MILRNPPRARRYLTAAVLFSAGLLTASPAMAQEEVLAIGVAIGEVYHTYKDITEIGQLLSGDPTQQDLMLAKLTELENDYKTKIQSQLDAIAKKIDDATLLERRIDFKNTRDKVNSIRATARTGSEEIALWVQSRRQDSAVLANAKRDSLLAANEMLEGTSLFQRPGQGETDFVFDYRIALPGYLYVLTVRQAVLSLAEPDFRTNPVYQDEFTQHLKRIDDLLSGIDAPIACSQSGFPPDSNGFYDICSSCADPITNASSFINGEISRPNVPACEDPLNGSAQDYADGLNFFTFYDRYRTQDKVGYVALRNLRDLVEANTHSTGVVQRYQYRALIADSGTCLTAPGLVMEPCDGSPAQEWQRDSYGALLSLTRCLQVHRFGTSNGAALELDDCSRAPGERWTLTTTGEVRGIGGKCLEIKDRSTAAGARVQMWDCWGGANQHWSWASPPGPAIMAIDPTSGPIAGGTYVHLTGSGFDPNAPTGNNMQAFFNDVASDYLLCEDSARCTVRSPKFAAAGQALIRVRVSGISSTQPALFMYHAHPMLTGMDWFAPTGIIAVRLDGYAPDGGTTVAISSGDPSALSVPASVTVAAGSSGATFPVAFLPTSNAGVVNVIASYEGVSLSAKVSVAAWPPLSIDLASVLAAGASSTASVNLNTPAPVGGASVSLTSSDPSAIPVPASLTVPPGQKTAAFTITNHYSGLPEEVTIGASYKGFAASGVLFVPREPTCRPHSCPRGSHWEPCECVPGPAQ